MNSNMMRSECPKCNTPLPEIETLKFRFCPHCGAEIVAERQQLDDAYLMVPPESALPRSDQQQFNLKPPDTPPPASFFRSPPDRKTPALHSEDKGAAKKDIEKQRPTRNRNLIIAAMIILAMIILLLGGLFTF